MGRGGTARPVQPTDPIRSARSRGAQRSTASSGPGAARTPGQKALRRADAGGRARGGVGHGGEASPPAARAGATRVTPDGAAGGARQGAHPRACWGGRGRRSLRSCAARGAAAPRPTPRPTAPPPHSSGPAPRAPRRQPRSAGAVLGVGVGRGARGVVPACRRWRGRRGCGGCCTAR